MKLYDLLMLYDYDDYSDYLDKHVHGEEVATLTVKVNGTYFYLPFDKNKRRSFLEEQQSLGEMNLESEVSKVCIQPVAFGRGEDIALKIFT